MADLTTASADTMLTAAPCVPTDVYYLSLHSGSPGTTGANEISGGSYARQAITFGNPSAGSQASSGTDASQSFTGMPLENQMTMHTDEPVEHFSATNLVLNETAAKLQTRLSELEPMIAPLLAEQDEIADALQRITGERPMSRARSTRPLARVRASVGSSHGGRGRPPGSGKRAQEVLECLHNEPGLNVASLADRLGMAANYLYRVLPGLQSEGKVTKIGKNWFPVEADEEPTQDAA